MSAVDAFDLDDPSNMPVPRLRSDLKLLPAAAERTGEPAWTIRDPARNRYFRIGPLAFECLIRWPAGTIGKVIDSVSQGTVHRPNLETMQRLIFFLQSNSLIERHDTEAPASFKRIADAGRPPWWKAAVHNYLFFRIPLVRPTGFLRATQHIADALASTAVRNIIILLGLVGLFLVSRQWDAFLATFIGFLNWQGAAALGVTLALTKILHELGHAYTVTRYGGRVPTMGLAFLLLYPMLYTDTSDAYRLTSRRARLAVGLAGIRVELMLALLATFIWSFLPDGPIRSAVFMVATATWISTLLINLSPFLRFDGYYILADWVDIPNLQPRAFALTRWWLRETLFGFGLAPPERFPSDLQRFLILYGFATWIYRFFLFLTIALLVYSLFFKLAGIILFVVEILWFIVIPVCKEIIQWAKLRQHFRLTINLVCTLAVLGGLIWLFVTPWRTEVTAPVLIEATEETIVETAIPARVAEVLVDDGDPVKVGQVLVRLVSEQLDGALSANTAQIKITQIQLEQARLVEEDRGDTARLERQLQAHRAAQQQIEARRERLLLLAPETGVFRDLPSNVHPGAWVGSNTPIGLVVSNNVRARAYADQSDLPRLAPGADLRIIFEDPTRDTLTGTVRQIAGFGEERLDVVHLASIYGGDIAAEMNSEDETLTPLSAVYRMDIDLDAPPKIGRPLRGTAFIEAPAESYAVRTWRYIGAVLIRESGF